MLSCEQPGEYRLLLEQLKLMDLGGDENKNKKEAVCQNKSLSKTLLEHRK